MPLEPGERYTDLEVEIMNLVKHNRHDVVVYEANRKSTISTSIFQATRNVTAADFSIQPSFNFMEPSKGHLTMRAFETICRDLPDDDRFVMYTTEEAVKFGAAKLADNQWWSCAIDTLVFDVNFLDLAGPKPDMDNERLTATFNDMVSRRRPNDIFKKKFLLFPIYVKSECYLTLIVNPMGFVKARNRPVGGSSFMVHIGSKNLTSYHKIILPRIFKTLELFMELHAHAEGYEHLSKTEITHFEITLPLMPTWEKSSGLFYAMDKFLNKNTRIEKWRKIIETIGNDEEEMFADMESVRKRIGKHLYNHVKENGNRVGKHLVEKRELVVEYYRKLKLERMEKEGTDEDVDEESMESARRIYESDRQLQLDRERRGAMTIY